MPILDSYEQGQKLTEDDFVDDYYFPMGKYDYAEVVDVRDNIVELLYVNTEQKLEDRQIFSKEEMEEMLGWNLERGENELVNDDDDLGIEIEDKTTTEEMAMSDKKIMDEVNQAHVVARKGNREFLDSDLPMMVHVSDRGQIEKVTIFNSKEDYMEALNG